MMTNLVSVSVAKTDVFGSPIERGSGTVITECIKENDGDRIGLIVLNKNGETIRKRR
jgi:hypothetical protein